MKKAVALLLLFLMVCPLAACGRQEQAAESIAPESLAESPAGTAGTKPSGLENDEEAEEPARAENETEAEEPSGQQSVQEPAESTGNSNILIVYFSRWGNTEYSDDVDATTSASIVDDADGRYGTTEYVANMIQQTVGGDIHLIETVAPYTEDFDELQDMNHEEMDQNVLPKLKESSLDISAYDTVFIGCPVWAVRVPQAVLSFLDEYDLSGKTVIPFCTHDGYGAGSTYQQIVQASHAAVSLEGIAIDSRSAPGAQDTIREWLDSIGISDGSVSTDDSPEAAGEGETQIQIIIGDTVLEGVLYDTALAEEIKGYFPLTISAVGYGGREYYGGVDFYPENLEGGQRNFENGDITYCQAHHNMAIFYAQTENPNLSVDVIPIGRVTSDLSIFDSLDSREEITFSLVQ